MTSSPSALASARFFSRHLIHPVCFWFNVRQEVHSRQQSLVRETETLQNEQSRFQKQLHEKEIEQQQLAEAEEFEQADHLSGIIETLKGQTSSRAESLRSLIQEPMVLDRRREELTHAQVASLEKAMAALRTLQARHKKLYDKLDKWSSEQFRSEEHTSELQSLMRSSYAVFCLKKKKKYHPK